VIHVAGDRTAPELIVWLLLYPSRGVGGSSRRDGTGRSADQRALPITADQRTECRSARRTGERIDRHRLLKLLVLLTQNGHGLVALRIICDPRRLRNRSAARSGAACQRERRRQNLSSGPDRSLHRALSPISQAWMIDESCWFFNRQFLI